MSGPEHVVELAHGYTYSAHPLACAAGLATLDIYRDEKLFERARALEPKFADAVMSLKGEPNVVDIRTIGLTAGIDLASRPDLPGQRGFDGLNSAFHDNDLMLRVAGDTLALTPPLIVSGDRRESRQGDPGGGVNFQALPVLLRGELEIRVRREFRMRGRALRRLHRHFRVEKPSPHAPGASFARLGPASGARACRRKVPEHPDTLYRRAPRTLALQININARIAVLGGASRAT